MAEETKKKKSSAKSGGKWYWNWISKNIYIALLAAAVVVFVLFSLLSLITRHNKELDVPSFAGMTVEQAQKIADKSNMRLEVTDSVYIPRMALGVIYKQNPSAQSKVKKNRRILLTINAKSPKMVKMPSLVGYSLRQAQSELASQQLNIGKLIYEEDIATNNLLEQLYKGRNIAPGTEIPSESEIDLKLGMNMDDNTTFIPDLKDKPFQIIKSYLIDNSLNLGKVYFDNTVKTYADSLSAVVYKQVPAASNFEPVILGTPVSIYLTLDKTVHE